MKSLVVKRSIIIGGHKTSVSLEQAFWEAFKDIAALRNMTLSDLVMSIDAERKGSSVRSRLAALGLDIFPREQQTPEALAALQKAEIEKWWPIIKAANIKGE